MLHYRYSHVSTVKDDATKPEVALGPYSKPLHASLILSAVSLLHNVHFRQQKPPSRSAFFRHDDGTPVLCLSAHLHQAHGCTSCCCCGTPGCCMPCTNQAGRCSEDGTGPPQHGHGCCQERRCERGVFIQATYNACMCLYSSWKRRGCNWLSLYSLRFTHLPGSIQSHEQCLPCLASLSRTS
jgi:hypothetical protein